MSDLQNEYESRVGKYISWPVPLVTMLVAAGGLYGVLAAASNSRPYLAFLAAAVSVVAALVVGNYKGRATGRAYGETLSPDRMPREDAPENIVDRLMKLNLPKGELLEPPEEDVFGPLFEPDFEEEASPAPLKP